MTRWRLRRRRVARLARKFKAAKFCHIIWTDPLNQVCCQQIGRACGNDIVQEGKEPPSPALYGSVPAGGSEATIRWSFTDITPSTFRWRSERSINGATWQLQREILRSAC